MPALSPTPDEIASPPRSGSGQGEPLPPFDELYDRHAALVWRALRRLGVAEPSIEDAVQDVFVTAFRRLDTFEGRSAVSTWLYGIAAHVARNQRRRLRRHPEAPTADPDVLDQPTHRTPENLADEAESVRILYGLLDELDAEKREAFVLAELEQLTAPEIATSLGLNVNTVYARTRAARAAFEQALGRHRARERRRNAPCP